MDANPKQEPPADRQIAYRPAAAEDSRAVAELICQAGGGLYEFLFDDLIPFMSALDIVAAGVHTTASPLSHTNCRVATGRSAEVAGVINVFPAGPLGAEAFFPLLPARFEHVRPMLQLQDWGSMFINAIAVADAYRGNGIGTRLIDWAETHTRQAGLSRLSLHVWVDNVAAIKLYKRCGFVEMGVAELAASTLPHRGSLLMQKQLP